MSGMILGACLEADHRIREYEGKVRMQKRIMRDRAVWESYEKEFEEDPTRKKWASSICTISSVQNIRSSDILNFCKDTALVDV